MTTSRFFLSLAGTLLCAVLLMGPGCTVSVWQSAYGRHHPLAGVIWDASKGSTIDRATLVGRLARARFVLLGENHDNPDHHRLQAEVLHQLVQMGRQPAVGFEMLDMDDGPKIAKHLAAAPKDAAGLGAAVGWNQRGWPDWTLYQPIAKVALEAGLPIVATNLSRATVRTLRREGAAGLDRALLLELHLDRPAPPDLQRRLADNLREAHCGYVPEDRLETMIVLQRARDARMAQRMIAAGGSEGSIQVVGSGHARIDYGIPRYIAMKAKNASVASLAFLEVQEGKTRPRAYAAGFGGATLPFDYVWFTPRRTNVDPCEKFKAQLQRLKKKDERTDPR